MSFDKQALKAAPHHDPDVAISAAALVREPITDANRGDAGNGTNRS